MSDFNQVFSYQGHQVRTILQEREPWFVATDVCKVLEIGDTRRAIERLDEDEWSLTPVTDSLGRKQETYVVNEPGLYGLVLGSRKPEAKKFKRWVTHEVLPTIRKHGIYATGDVINQVLSNPDFGIKLLTTLKEERERRLKAEETNRILMHVNKTYTSTEIAKELGFRSARALNRDLAQRRIQFKQNNTWVLYSDYSDLGYVEIKQEVLDNGKVIYHRRWTQLGREFLVNLYRKEESA